MALQVVRLQSTGSYCTGGRSGRSFKGVRRQARGTTILVASRRLEGHTFQLNRTPSRSSFCWMNSRYVAIVWQEPVTRPCPHPQLLAPRSGSHRQVQLSSQPTGQRLCASLHGAVRWPIKEGLSGGGAEARLLVKPRRHFGIGQYNRALVNETKILQILSSFTFTS